MAEGSAVGGAAKWIGASLVEEGKYLYGIEDHVRALQSDLECIQALLQTVDGSSHRVLEADAQFRIFTKKIRELAFRAEDVIDTYVIDVGSKVYKKSLLSKLVCLVSHCYPVHMIRNEIEAIQQEIEAAKMRLKSFRESLPTTTSSQHQQGNLVGPSTSQPIQENYIHLDDEVVVGIDDAISQLAKRLINPEDDFKVVGIVGTGGGGKTTLATQLYRHSEVASWFTHKAFVSISQQWSKSDLFVRIFKKLKGEDSRIPSSEDGIVGELYAFLKDKKFLVVLDDIWNKEAWDDIYLMFPLANKGCRVILTTRIKEVIFHADNKGVIHEPNLLTEDQKWELFSKVAVEGRAHIEKNAEFEKLGKQMLEECEGIPLAVVTLAGILRTKQELYQWEEIGRACTANILKGKGGQKYGVVEDMLELSYLELPALLKPCLLYMACFPEDWVIEGERLIQMWIAEGLVIDDKQARRGTLEDAAWKLLDELAQRCILKVTSRNFLGHITRFRLHDLMRELCIKYAKESKFFETISSTNDSDIDGSIQPRRIAIFSRDVDVENHQLRTLVHFGPQSDAALKTLESIHDKFKLLRVLHIERVDIVALPEQIGDLIHLRYLAIIITKITKLPKSIRNLRNLLYLQWVDDYGKSVEVPNGLVCNMENLRGLELPILIKRDPKKLESVGLSGSKKLETLLCGAGKWMTKDLPTLSRTVRSLSIYYIKEVEEMEAIYGCPSIVEDSLSSLLCLGLGEVEFDLRKLAHCTTLRHLWLRCPLTSNCTGHFPPNLVELTLWKSDIERDDLMKVIGELPKLKSLCIWDDAYMGTQLSCSAGSAFPQLQELQLAVLRNLEEWRLEEGGMPLLRKIEIHKCEKLKRLPESIRSITTLKELHIEGMSKEFCRRLGYGGESSVGGEDSYIIQHIPTVKFKDIQ